MARIERVWGALVKRGEAIGHQVNVTIFVKEILANEGATLVKRIPDRVEFDASGIEDGEYLLKYTFENELREERRRVKDGRALGGW